MATISNLTLSSIDIYEMDLLCQMVPISGLHNLFHCLYEYPIYARRYKNVPTDCNKFKRLRFWQCPPEFMWDGSCNWNHVVLSQWPLIIISEKIKLVSLLGSSSPIYSVIALQLLLHRVLHHIFALYCDLGIAMGRKCS